MAEAKAKDAPEVEATTDAPEVDETAETPIASPESEAPVADAEAPVVSAIEAPSVPEVDPEVTDHVAIRDFKARFDHQVLSFKEGEVIDHRVGAALRALGSPIKLVEKAIEGLKGRK